MMYISKRLFLGCLTSILALSDASFAYDLDYELRVGVGHSDNISRTETNPISETVALAGVRLNLSHTTSGVDLNVVGDVEYRSYLDDTFDNDTFGSIDSDVVFTLSPRFLSWGVEHRFGHVVLDPFAPETPRTRERVNTLSTGPNITVPMGSANSLGLTGRFSDNSYSETDIDNETMDGQLSFSRALSRSRTIALNVAATRVEFDNSQLNSSFDRQSAFFEFDSQNSKGSINLRLGVNELHDQGVVRDGELIELTFVRDLTARTSFELLANQRLTFVGEAFNNRQGPGQIFQDTQNIAGVADPLEIQRLEAIIRLASNATNLSASVSTQDESYLNQFQLDRNVLMIRVAGGLQLGQPWRLNFTVSARQTDFDVSPREDDDLIMTIGLRRQLSRIFSLEFDVSRIERNSNQAGSSYDENVAYLTLRYSP